ncbi:CDP-alcohol phosphatidyltransferase family protein [Haloglycomyces albus]|uniref:CDP-alcohol phosphatidyltransferase family protein n=1 Tax=Haloglycomyces albus TaxID=526067 RepID=UPI00046D7514|nr:phosphatidylcholine/phosphatidylserine synthase [Haloglycomyces albus]
MAAPEPIPLLPGEHTLARRCSFALANCFTLASITLALFSIVLATDGQLTYAAAALVGCVLADGLDGPVARRFGVASPFGAQMDSLADMCAFGVATPILFFCWMEGTFHSVLLLAISVFFGACAAIRLARFNVSPKDGRYFSGVPTTLAAAVVTLSALLLDEPIGVVGILTATCAIFMISPFPYPKLGQLAKLPIWLWALPIAGFWFDHEMTFYTLVWAYLGAGPILWIGLRRGKESEDLSGSPA